MDVIVCIECLITMLILMRELIFIWHYMSMLFDIIGMLYACTNRPFCEINSIFICKYSMKKEALWMRDGNAILCFRLV